MSSFSKWNCSNSVTISDQARPAKPSSAKAPTRPPATSSARVGLSPTGVVDAVTAAAINAAVEARQPIPEQFAVSGEVHHEDGSLLAGLTVKTFDQGMRGETQLGEPATTDERGAYSISFASAQVAELGKRRPDLLVRVHSPEGRLLAESGIAPNARDETRVDLLVVPRVGPTREEVVAHEVTLRLLNQETGEPLIRHTVRTFDLDAGAEPLDLGFDITNGRGLCAAVFTTPRADERPVRRRLRLHVTNPAGKEIAQTKIQIESDGPSIVDVRVPVPAIPERPSPVLRELNQTLALRLPDTTVAHLEGLNVRTLDDVRKAGGLGGVEGLPPGMDQEVVRRLNAHAQLSVLSPDLQINTVLINNGFEGVGAIARTPRSEFVQKLSGQIDAAQATQFHNGAMAQSMFLGNAGTMIAANLANRYSEAEPNEKALYKAFGEKLPNRCICRDCESAVSPSGLSG